MAYTEPKVIAETKAGVAFAAGCPSKDHASPAACTYCQHGY